MLLAAGAAQAAGKGAVLVIDGNTGRVLHQSAADELRHPASLAKMMTIYIAFELIEQGRLNYQTKIKMSANAVAAAPSKLDLAEGEEIALIDALKVLITKSANDIAVAVAEHIAGSEERFARLMTQKARQLGMAATVFRNASGLPDDAQVTTARDMVTLALRLQDDFPRHYPLFATRTATYKDETFRNHNTLLFSYEGTDGLKTGYTRASGFNLVTSVRRGRKHVVGVVFGGASAASRNTAMRTFLNMGLVKASNEKTRQPAAALVAQAPRPAPNRRIASVPKPKRVARPPARVAAAAPPPPPALPTAAEPAAVQPASAQAQATTPPIEIARVRSVLVTPRGASPGPGEQPERVLAGPGGQVPPQADAPREQAAAEPAASPMRSWTRAASALLPPPPPPESAAMPAPFPDAAAGRGAPPSTLEQQASNLARGEHAVATPATTAALPSPQPLPPAREPAVTTPPSTAALPSASRGPFQIQIGAFQSQAEAERQLVTARERAGSFLARGAAVTQPVQQGQKVLYRARYSGFDASAAAKACSELKRLKIDCLVMKAE